MASIQYVTIETTDPEAAAQFYATAFGLDDRVRARASDAPASGFRGFTLSLVVAQPGNAHALVDAAVTAGATVIKPVSKSLWGVGGSVQAPDGTIWTVASSAKKDTGPATKEIESLVLLLGVDDVSATKRFYVEHGFTVDKSFGGKYVEFEPEGGIALALNKRKALAKNAGVDPEGTGSHRIAIASTAGAFTDPDGFIWEDATPASSA